MRFCKNCGMENPAGSAVCQNCGSTSFQPQFPVIPKSSAPNLPLGTRFVMYLIAIFMPPLGLIIGLLLPTTPFEGSEKLSKSILRLSTVMFFVVLACMAALFVGSL